MPTTNVSITSTWTKLAENTNTELLVTWDVPVKVEIAATLANSVPTVDGHSLTHEDAITRNLIGAGYVWARLVAGTKPSSVKVVVSK